jgi:hypothetical protein
LQAPSGDVGRVGEDHRVNDLCDPSVLARGEVDLGTGQHGVGAAHVLHPLAGGRDGREGVEVGRVGVEPAEIALIDGFDVVADRAVVVTVEELAADRVGQAEFLGDLQRRHPVVGHPHRLVMEIAVDVTLTTEPRLDVGGPPSRPVVAGKCHVDSVDEQLQRLIDVSAP